MSGAGVSAVCVSGAGVGAGTVSGAGVISESSRVWPPMNTLSLKRRRHGWSVG